MEMHKNLVHRTSSVIGLLLIIALIFIKAVHASSLDGSFNPDVDKSVSTIAIQPNGKILIGGGFNLVAGTTRNYIARLNADGSLDTTFLADLNAGVTTIAVQLDGKILISGGFTTVNGVSRRRLARLEVDGTLDSAFDANVVGQLIQAVTIQPDGKILFGGTFTSVGGIARNNFARLNSDGTLDTGFDPDVDSFISSIALQADNKILIGGGFNTVVGTDGSSGTIRNHVARLHPDGNLDTTFNPNVGNTVRSIAVQADGKILIGGGFDSVGGVSRNRIARLEPDTGAPDSFSPDVQGNVESIIIQADGKILISGQFINVDSTSRSRVARLEVDGSLDSGFATGIDGGGFVWDISLQADGKPLIGGFFNSVAGTTRNNMARLITSDSIQSVVARQDGGRVNWLRGGTAPEVNRSTLEISLDATNWTSPVPGQRTSGGWQFDGLNIEQQTLTYLRLRGVYGSSQSITETIQQVLLSPDKHENKLCMPIKAANSKIVIICL